MKEFCTSCLQAQVDQREAETISKPRLGPRRSFPPPQLALESAWLRPPPHQSSPRPESGPLYGRGWGPLVQRLIRARSYRCGWRCPAAGRLRDPVLAAPALPTQPGALAGAVLGACSAGPSMGVDRSPSTSGVPDRLETALCLVLLPVKGPARAPGRLRSWAALTAVHVGHNWVPRWWHWKCFTWNQLIL